MLARLALQIIIIFKTTKDLLLEFYMKIVSGKIY